MRALILLSFLPLLACGSHRAEPEVGVPADATQVELGRESTPAAFAIASGFTDSARVVVRNRSQWNEVWARIVGNASPAPDPPEIDFGTEMILVAAMGTRPSGGYAIRIDRASRRGNTLWAEVTSVQPGARCVTSATMTAPVDVVVVQRTSGDVRFVESSEVRNC